ncbi:hypothetical protein INR49_015513 [Caranx melampygus]|nr:hypothetical protein INR49_015513 [Caranx melampygus]
MVWLRDSFCGMFLLAAGAMIRTRKRKTKEGTDTTETEETDGLVDLLRCSHSPWWNDVSWSPQASALRELAALSPECLHGDFIYRHFTTLRIVDKGVSVIDDGLLKFLRLEELVLSANKLSEVPAENLPSTLKILELRANWLSDIASLTNSPPPRLQYLSLSSNHLGRHDVSNLIGRHWPQLVCLDLSDCEFEEQQALLSALTTLPCLKTLVVEGNPFTLAPSYPGLTVDSLPKLSYLDNSWISPEDRHRFRGMAKMSDLMVDHASATVSVGRLSGIPDPLMSVDENAPDFPVVTFSYFITYEFFSPEYLKANSRSKSETAHVTDDTSSDAKKCDRETSKADGGVAIVNTEETCCAAAAAAAAAAHVSRRSTSKLAWTECMDFSDTQMYVISDLGGLKQFFNQGLYVSIEEEKVLSWPAVPEEPVPAAKPSRTQSVKEKKGGKGKESPIKSGSIKDKPKDKKRKSVPELVQHAPIRRSLGSVHISLQSLLKGDHKDVNIKEDKRTEDNESKQRGGSSTRQKNTPSSKGKGKGKKEREVDVNTHSSPSTQLGPVTVELSSGPFMKTIKSSY